MGVYFIFIIFFLFYYHHHHDQSAQIRNQVVVTPSYLQSALRRMCLRPAAPTALSQPTQPGGDRDRHGARRQGAGLPAGGRLCNGSLTAR